jgi:hypothetical protein
MGNGDNPQPFFHYRWSRWGVRHIVGLVVSILVRALGAP